MIIKIGDTITFGGNSKFQIAPPLSGLTSPDIRTGDGLYAGVDGGYVSSQLYGFRNIVISGFYIGKTCQEADELRQQLMSELHIRYLYPIFITSFSGKHYFVEGYITDRRSDITNPTSGEFQITIHCPDPIIYDGGDGVASDSAWFEQTFYKEQPGGFNIAYKVPVTWVGGQMATNIENLGTVAAYPIITLSGKFTNPKITNLTTNEFIELERTTTASDTIVIDMKERIITLNGVSIASSRTIDSSWWTLSQGDNKIVLETDSNSDNNFGTIKYKVGYLGV